MEDLVKPILELFCSCLCHEFGDRMELEQNVHTLSSNMAELRGMREVVQRRVDLAEGRLKQVRTPEVARWLASVEKLDKDVADAEEELEAGRREPLPRWWHAPARGWRRCELSRTVAVKLREAQYLRRHGEFKFVAENPKPAPPSPLVHRQ